MSDRRATNAGVRSATVLALLCFSDGALGWTCPADPNEDFRSASAVFMASVVSNEVVVTAQGGKYTRTRLKVIESWKSDGGKLDEVVTSDSGVCFRQLYFNTTYIIFGMRYTNGELAADMYSSTTPLYWDGECPSRERQCPVVDEKAAGLLSFLAAGRGK